jgi:DNA polymerase III epsilon subunit-like protein
MGYLFLGLDGEMSSSELSEGGKLIQIGIATEEGINISYTMNPGECQWSEAAFEVHGITLESLQSAPSPAEIDEKLYEDLLLIGADPKRRSKTIPVGFNVGAFDMPFVKDSLPKSFSLFSRRTVDLNALCFALDHKVDGGMPVNADTWKKRAKAYAIEQIGMENQHDAGWDAMMHYRCYEFLRNMIANTR